MNETEPTKVDSGSNESGRVRMYVLVAFRVMTALALGALGALGWTRFDWESSLNIAIVAMAGFVLAQTIWSFLWARPYLPGGSAYVSSPPADASNPPANASNPPAPAIAARTNGFAEAAKVAITTQGVVLGLISFSGANELTTTVKIGAASLAAGVLLATSLYLVVAQNPPPDDNRRFAASILMSLLLWTLSFGLVCVVSGSWSNQ